MKIYDELGEVAIGTRLRFLGELITQEATEIYGLYDIPMNPKWFPVFYTLTQNSDRSISEIAAEIGHSHVSVIKIVSEMKEAGLVAEKKNAKDLRQRLVRLTASGRKVSRRIEMQYTDVRGAIAKITAATKADLWKALAEWEELLNEKSFFERVQNEKKLREACEVKIVPYSEKFQSAFRNLNKAWISKYFKMEKADFDALDAPKEYILDKGGFIYVALVKNEPVGVCALIKRADKNYPYELAKMAVDPKMQGKKIGWLLGQAIVEHAKRLGSKNLYLESNTKLKPAIRLYEKLGFKKVEGGQTPYERCNIQMELKFIE